VPGLDGCLDGGEHLALEAVQVDLTSALDWPVSACRTRSISEMPTK
jgi:hypothetical protein